MKALLKKLRANKKELKEELIKVDKAIDALKAVCKHELPDGKDAYEYYGNDSHYDYYSCSICSDKQKR